MTRSEPFDAAQVSRHVPDLKIGDHIDSGSFKDVYKGADADGEPIAIKVCRIPTQDRLNRAEREIRAMQLVDHPGFVKLIEVRAATIDGEPCIIMAEEFIDGTTLSDHLAASGSDPILAFDVARTLLSVIECFQKYSIVHRDIKPANIMLSQPDLKPKLLDIGLVRFLDEPSLTPTAWQRGPGTPNYAAPEQFSNEKALQDARTDMFATGIVFYEVANGQHPFEHSGLAIPEAIAAGDQHDWPGFGEDDGHAERLDAFYKRLTATQPYQRFRTASIALEELSDLEGAICSA